MAACKRPAPAIRVSMPCRAAMSLPSRMLPAGSIRSLPPDRRLSDRSKRGEMIEAPPPSSDHKAVALLGYVVILTCIGGVGAWAAFAPIDSAVSAHASVALESHRQVVQHLEGGIIKEIFVKEGATVTEGDVLFRLDDTQTRSNLDLVQNQ